MKFKRIFYFTYAFVFFLVMVLCNLHIIMGWNIINWSLLAVIIAITAEIGGVMAIIILYRESRLISKELKRNKRMKSIDYINDFRFFHDHPKK